MEYLAIGREVRRFQRQSLTDAESGPGKQSEEHRPSLTSAGKDFSEFRFGYGWPVLFLSLQDRHPDEVVIPLARVNFFALIVNSGSHNHFDDFCIVDDGLCGKARREPSSLSTPLARHCRRLQGSCRPDSEIAICPMRAAIPRSW